MLKKKEYYIIFLKCRWGRENKEKHVDRKKEQGRLRGGEDN